jgi:NAD-dependent SIR2 family protein deacetylase
MDLDEDKVYCSSCHKRVDTADSIRTVRGVRSELRSCRVCGKMLMAITYPLVSDDSDRVPLEVG